MGPYGTYVTAVIGHRALPQLIGKKTQTCPFKFTVRGAVVSFVVYSCDSKLNVSDLPAQRLERHSILKFQ